MSDSSAPLKQTPFHALHVALGAKIVPFAGYEMPVQYPSGITAEHKAVRERCGLFDVSHMGEFVITGARRGRLRQLRHDQRRRRARDRPGALLHHPQRPRHDRGRLPRLSLRRQDHDGRERVEQRRRTSRTSRSTPPSSGSTVRGRRATTWRSSRCRDPATAKILQPLTKTDLSAIKYYHFAEGEVAGMPMIISRTGYTGEDGFELYHDVEVLGVRLWDALMAAGDVTPAGLGARDSLRLEMGMALYGNDIDDTVTPLEANLALAREAQEGRLRRKRRARRSRRSRGVAAEARRLHACGERNFPRHGYPVFVERRGERRRAQRHDEPDARHPDRHLLRAGGDREGGDARSRSRSAASACRATVVKLPFYKDASHL